MECPQMMASPCVALSRPVSTFTLVVLPLPFGPSRPKIESLSTANDTPRTACTRPAPARADVGPEEEQHSQRHKPCPPRRRRQQRDSHTGVYVLCRLSTRITRGSSSPFSGAGANARRLSAFKSAFTSASVSARPGPPRRLGTAPAPAPAAAGVSWPASFASPSSPLQSSSSELEEALSAGDSGEAVAPACCPSPANAAYGVAAAAAPDATRERCQRQRRPGFCSGS
mmetsp:Transcript_6755/g.21407  ORF Transcript_6755/g.21407 Transcript_6755/m.21407 type:complete len:227 (-) Transcript_6755:1722-2402(-)